MKFSVITICFNNKEGVIRTAESLLNQTFRGFEWIIIDGGSKDGSKEIIEQYASDPYNNIIYWCSEPDTGIYNAMNKGISHASGDYVIFLNSGDSFVSNKLLEGVSKRNISADLVIGDIVLTYSDGSYYYKHSPEIMSVQRLIKESVPHQSTFTKLSLFKTYGGYDETFKIISDYVFFWKMIVENKRTYECLPIPISYYDVTGISATNTDKYNSERDSFLTKYIDRNILNTLRHHNDIPYMLAAYTTSKCQVSCIMFVKHIIAAFGIAINRTYAFYKYIKYCKLGLY